MKILFLMTLSFVIPTICFAHSGTVINAVSNYLPFLLPIIAGIIAFGRQLFNKILSFFKNIHK